MEGRSTSPMGHVLCPYDKHSRPIHMTDYDSLTLANAFIQTGELDDALDALNQHLEAKPEDDEARRLRVQVLMRMEGKIQWEAIMEDSLALKKPTVDDYVKMSSLSEQMNDYDSALFFTVEALKLQPDDNRLIERRVRLMLEAEGDPIIVDQLLEQLPEHWRWSGWRGEIALLQGNFDRAVEQFSAALSHLEQTMDTTNVAFAANLKAQILLKRASVHHNIQALAEADADYAAAEQIIPDDPMIRFNRGLIAFLQEDSERGIALCRDAYANAPAALRDEMQKALAEDERYAPIAAAIQA